MLRLTTPGFTRFVQSDRFEVVYGGGEANVSAALAADDPLFAGRGMGLIDSWMAAKKPVEFHLYGQGGHGFGMYPKETTSTGWFDAFYRWIVMNGFTKPAA